MVLRTAVLIGGSGTALQVLLDAAREGSIPAEVVVVVSHNVSAGGLDRARRAGVPAEALALARRHSAMERAAFEQTLLDLLQLYDVDLIVLAGWMLILSERVLDRYPGAVLNLHPALLPGGSAVTMKLSDGREQPVFRGAHAVRDALAAGVSVTGATVHLTAPAFDTGEVLASQEVPILPTDIEETLHQRIKEAEHNLLLQVMHIMPERLLLQS